MVLYVLHIRMNAAWQLLVPNGILDWFLHCVKNKTQAPFPGSVGTTIPQDDFDHTQRELLYPLPEIAKALDISSSTKLPEESRQSLHHGAQQHPCEGEGLSVGARAPLLT
jgi:hypothetical protein